MQHEKDIKVPQSIKTLLGFGALQAPTIPNNYFGLAGLCLIFCSVGAGNVFIEADTNQYPSFSHRLQLYYKNHTNSCYCPMELQKKAKGAGT